MSGFRPATWVSPAELRRSYRRWEGLNKAVLRDHLAERDGPWCRYCGCDVVLEHDDPRNPYDPATNAWTMVVPFGTIDHVVPQILGGTHDLANLVLACGDCNTRKGTRR